MVLSALNVFVAVPIFWQPNSIQKGNEEASEEIGQLKAKYFEQVSSGCKVNSHPILIIVEI